jgi:hypothetical protein
MKLWPHPLDPDPDKKPSFGSKVLLVFVAIMTLWGWFGFALTLWGWVKAALKH